MVEIDQQLPLDIPPSTAPRQVREPRYRAGPHAVMAVAQSRLTMIAAGIAGLFFIVALRLVDATILQGSKDSIAANEPGQVHQMRADMVDRNGEMLAVSLPVQSLYADPKKLLDPAAAARGVVKVLPELKYEDVLDKLTSSKRFVWLKRALTPEEVYQINALGFPGLEFETEYTRLYPAGGDTVHAIGYTDVDGHGLSGLERGMDKRLSAGGDPVELSIDLRVQHIVERELAETINTFRAIGGLGLVMDMKTGELLAAVSLPDYNPLQAGQATDEARFNRFAQGTYELGSVIKIITIAGALESGHTTLNSFYDADNSLRYGRFTIRDYHPEHRWLSVPEIFLHSSNLGAGRIALDMGIQYQHEFMCKIGLCGTLRTELAEPSLAILPNDWSEVAAVTISFGHGISLTPLHLMRATAATLTGHLVNPTFLKNSDNTKQHGAPVISANTVDQMRRLMRANAVKGTGSSANIEGYFVGGKTGTAEKAAGRTYNENARLSSFIAAFPMHDPRYLVYAMVDEPQGIAATGGYATGGTVGAPLVGRIISQMAPLLGIEPHKVDDPAIREALRLNVLSREEAFETY